jgi:PAS domain S-box-containing protein
MQVNIFTERLKDFQQNLLELYNSSDNGNGNGDGNGRVNSLVSSAFKQLGVASEEIEVAIEELRMQVETLAAMKMELEVERRHYLNLFEFLSEAYLVTDLQGNILQANQASANLLKVEARFLIGKPLDLFFTNSNKQAFPTKLARICQGNRDRQWTVDLQPRYGTSFPVQICAFLEENKIFENYPLVIHWRIGESEQQSKDTFSLSLSEFLEKRPKQTYQQGETIPLESTDICLIYQGWVKLITINDDGEEITIGLVGESMPFGAGMTSLPTYQASVLSEKAQIVSISLSELERFSSWKETIFAQLLQRIRQTEALLAISGTRQIQNRVYCFLLWLKENFGQSLPQGDRLKIRLTHQEIANACCTSRVTITRVLGKLKKQGKIAYDSQYHIILLK